MVAALIPLALFGLSDDGGTANLVGWTLPLVRVLVHLTSLTAIALLCVGVLLPAGDLPADGSPAEDSPADNAGSENLSPLAVRLGRRGSVAALAAVVVCGVFLLWTYFEVLGEGPLQGAGFADFGVFLDQLASGRALIAQIGFLLASAVTAWVARTSTALKMALFLAVAGTTTLALGGHAASESGHGLAMFSMTGHIAAASVWVGGLAGLGWLALHRNDELHTAVKRFSRLALICAAVVTVSGVVSAVVRVPDLAALPGSLYGLVLLLKVVVLGGLIGIGALHRRRLLAGTSFSRGDFGKLAAGELVVMGVAYGLAVALVGLEPPL
ncbi:putative copper resistance protein D [Arthrobacter tumbae]|nr:putative copper resistance protein D [Arthrobacter tumbae]